MQVLGSQVVFFLRELLLSVVSFLCMSIFYAFFVIVGLSCGGVIYTQNLYVQFFLTGFYSGGVILHGIFLCRCYVILGLSCAGVPLAF